MDETLQALVIELADKEAIRTLKARYCAACDDNHNPERLAPLFTEDAVWEANVMGRAEGRSAIAQQLGELGPSGRIRNSAHHAINPDIEVAGDTATGHWRLIMLYTENLAAGQVRYQRIVGWYQERYRKISGRWYFEHLKCTVEESAPYVVADEAESFS